MAIEIRLKALEISHIDSAYVAWHQNSDGHLDHFTGRRRSFSRDDILHEYQASLKDQNRYYYLIESTAGEKIGNIKIGPIDLINKTSDLVCLIGDRNFVGMGLAAKAISLGNEIAFQNHDIRRLQGGMYENNIASIKAYKKAGWFIEAIFRGYYWVDGQSQDRVCVACLNPKYFMENPV